MNIAGLSALLRERFAEQDKPPYASLVRKSRICPRAVELRRRLRGSKTEQVPETESFCQFQLRKHPNFGLSESSETRNSEFAPGRNPPPFTVFHRNLQFGKSLSFSEKDSPGGTLYDFQIPSSKETVHRRLIQISVCISPIFR